MKSNSSNQKGAIAWMASHGVTANLLMFVFLVGGLLFFMQTKQEVFPKFEMDMVTINVAYPGASPEEVEQSIVLPIEEAIEGLTGIEEINSTSSEGSASVQVELLDGEDLQRLASDIKNEVDRITTFPLNAEEPLVSIVSDERTIVSMAIYGDLEPWALRSAAETVRNHILDDKEIIKAEFRGARDYEVTVEISSENLRRYGLTLKDVADQIKQNASDVAGGGIDTASGEILLRVNEKKYYAPEFSQIPIVSSSDGARLLLQDIATIRDGFEESDMNAYYKGFPSILLDVYSVGEQAPIGVSDATLRLIEELEDYLPDSVQIDVVKDDSVIFRQRAELLIKNLLLGLLLVLFVLGIFLELRLAFWVTLGIPISFVGSFLFMPYLDVTLNMISMFAYIITLGIVVDDAIVVGENIYKHHEQGKSFFRSSIDGTREVAMAVTFSILTNVSAFLPLAFIPGVMGKIFKVIPLVVITVFLVSLVESIFILPAHLSHQKGNAEKRQLGIWGRYQQAFSRAFTKWIRTIYVPWLERVLKWRYVVLGVGIALIFLTLSYIGSGRMRLIMFPRVEADQAHVEAELPFGSAVEDTEALRQHLEAAAYRVADRYGREEQVKGVFSLVGRGGSHKLSMDVYLTDVDVRPLPTNQFVKEWRQEVGNYPGVDSILFQSDFGGPGAGKALTVELSHSDMSTLEVAASDLANHLAEYGTTKDISDGFQLGKPQLNFKIKPAAESLGLTAQEIGNQVRSSFYGSEALRQARGRDEVKVMVKLPREERVRESTLDSMIIRTPANGELPLNEAVEVNLGRSYTTITRRDGRRVIQVTADTDKQSDAGPIQDELNEIILPELAGKYPGLRYGYDGKQADISESFSALVTGLLMALGCVYILLAIPLNSYVQPAIIMSCVPFGIVGAVWGHLIMRYELSMMSLFGVVALIGVVINDSLVMIDFVNKRRAEGIGVVQAVYDAAGSRFRAIILTTLTTFLGLSPMILETSMQAKFMIPMAISLGFGILFSTAITLILVPCLYLILHDVSEFTATLFRKNEDNLRGQVVTH